MDRLFVYRTVPQLKFQFNKTVSASKLRKKPKQSYSQKILHTQTQQKVLFKTKNNILIKDYDSKDKQYLNNKSVLLSSPRQQLSKSKIRFNKVRPQLQQIKFHQLSLNDISWQKWKSPFSIINVNKQLTHRLGSKNRFRTQKDHQSKDQKQLQMAKNQMKQKKMQRQIGQLNRLKRYVKDKKQVINLMSKIHQQQQRSVKRTFTNFKDQVQQVCQFYKHEKFENFPLQQRLKTSIS